MLHVLLVLLMVVFELELQRSCCDVLRFGCDAMCPATTTKVLQRVLGNIIVMVPLCHGNECGCF